MDIRPYQAVDEGALIELWRRCGLVGPRNPPREDIAQKFAHSGELLFVGVEDRQVVASVMAGYDGHRGWINYLGVVPECRGQGNARRLVAHAEEQLRGLGCRKVNLQVRHANEAVVAFYQRLGYSVDDVVSLGRRLDDDARSGPRAGDD